MEPRKLILFGNSSLVFSVPKDWVVANGLKKGDSVFLEVEKNKIQVYPSDTEGNVEKREITLDIEDMDKKSIKRKLVSLYIANYSKINIVGDSVEKKSRDIRNIVQELMALEIIEQTSKRVVAQAYVDYREVNVKSLIVKEDIILRSMFEDCVKRTKSARESIHQRDKDINKLSYLVARILRSALVYPTIARHTSLSPIEILKLNRINFTLEKIGDEIKEITDILSKCKYEEKVYKKILPVVGEISKFYLEVMKTVNKNDAEKAFNLAGEKSGLNKKMKNFEESSKNQGFFLDVSQHFINIIRFCNDICRIMFT